MTDKVLIVGFDEPEFMAIKNRLDVGIGVVAHELLPKIVVKDGQLFAESRRGPWMVPISKVVFHGIFEDDLDFIAGLALWGGPCLPNARAMMDCRLKLPCLVRALQFSRFAAPLRGYVSPGARFETETERVAKWGNWHCGENKARFSDSWMSENACTVEPFLSGRAVRIVLISDRYWQIGLEGESWLKSIHDPRAAVMEVDAELLADARAVRDGFGLELLANDYIVSQDGSRHLLEVNHIPNVTRFPEIWEAYLEHVVDWLSGATQI